MLWINSTRGITITHPFCPRRRPQGHSAPAGLVAAEQEEGVGKWWGGSRKCFVQLLDYKNVGCTGRVKKQGLVILSA